MFPMGDEKSMKSKALRHDFLSGVSSGLGLLLNLARPPCRII